MRSSLNPAECHTTEAEEPAALLAQWALGVATIVPVMIAMVFGLDGAILFGVPLIIAAALVSVALGQDWHGDRDIPEDR